MFSALGADLIGTSDNCSILNKTQFATEGAECLSFLLPGEVPYIIMKAKVQQHMFTDQAYIRIIRDNAAGTKQFVDRFPWACHRLTDVKFITAGLGATDLDCNLNFQLGNYEVRIEIKKPEQEHGKHIFKFLCLFKSVLDENQRIYSALSNGPFGIKSLMPSLSSVDSPQFFNALATQAEAMERRFHPTSYRSIFESYFPSA